MNALSRFLTYAAAIVLAAWALPSPAQNYPSRAVRLVVPFAPGGSTDVLGRIVAQRLSESVGHPVIVDNRPAGGGTVGSDVVARATPDGHTLLVGSVATMVFAPALHRKLSYDPLKDFEHVGLWVTFPLALVVSAGASTTSLKALIEQARAKPGSLKHGLQGIGTSSHVFNELMCSLAGVKVNNIAYKGGAPALTAVLVGEIDYAMVAVSTALVQVKAGKARALGVTSAQPVASLPGVPPIASVVPGYEALNFHGLHAPAKTPKAVVAKLHEETTKVLQRPDVRERLAPLAMDIAASSPPEYRAFIQAQIKKWAPLIKASGTRID
jgi:tripartite-type tricarboxylate transporter receptor subunit TctC